MNRDQQHEAAKESLAAGWRAEGPERTDHLITALTHAVLALSAPLPQPPPGPGGERLTQLFDSIRELGGQWDAKRARARYSYLGWNCTLGRGKANLERLADGGYLTEVEKGVYELASPQEPVSKSAAAGQHSPNG
ncbi:hypothetical protein PL81_38480 [Streptomyces sp. RSD-27]|nr:hypothetical protein PL81_38480 [Streptomyces sp. RSD-27]